MKEQEAAGTKENKGYVVITGCDTGIGYNMAIDMLEKGYSVIISYLENNPFSINDDVHAKKLDLRKQEDVDGFCAYVQNICKEQDAKLSGIVMNAGVALGGPVENIPMNIYRECFEINYFGLVTIMKALIPSLIRSKGRIMVIGSLAGRIALPFLSPYVSTKFALEGFCDSLRREMNPFGIKTILIEPAAVATPIWNKAKRQDISFVDKKYMKSLYLFRDNFIEDGNTGLSAEVAAAKISDIFSKKCPRSRYIIAKNSFVSKLMLLLPSWLVDFAVKKCFRWIMAAATNSCSGNRRQNSGKSCCSKMPYL